MDKPDFSGTWTFDATRSRLQSPSPDEAVFTIEHREPALHLSRTHIVGSGRDTFSIDLTIGGREVVSEHGGLRIRARARWEGETLVFDSTLASADEEATNIVRYSLSKDRQSFVAEEQCRSRSLNYDNCWVLQRALPPGDGRE